MKMYEIIRLRPDHSRDLYRQIARMHAQAIHHGVLPQLGLPFLSAVYTGVTDTNCGFVFVARDDRMVLGFIAGSTNMHRMYAEVFLKYGWLLLKSAGVNLLKIELWKKAWNVVSYPLRQEKTHLAGNVGGSELLAIAVHEDQRRAGLGGLLIQAFENELMDRCGRTSYTVATNKAEVASNYFYRKKGFQPIGIIPHHQLMLQIYQKNL